jgi:hypothetical protein
MHFLALNTTLSKSLTPDIIKAITTHNVRAVVVHSRLYIKGMKV